MSQSNFLDSKSFSFLKKYGWVGGWVDEKGLLRTACCSKKILTALSGWLPEKGHTGT